MQCRGDPDYVHKGPAESRKEKPGRVRQRKLSHVAAITHSDSSASLSRDAEPHLGQPMIMAREGSAGNEGNGSSKGNETKEDLGGRDWGTERDWSPFPHMPGTRSLASASMHADITFTR